MNCEIHPAPVALRFEVITAERLARWMIDPRHEGTDITRGEAPEGYLEVFLWGWPGRDFVKYITFADFCRYNEVLASLKNTLPAVSAATSEFRSSDASSAGPRPGA